MRILTFLMLLSASFFAQAPPIGPGVSHDLAIWRAARYNDVRYKLNLTLEKMSPVLKGTIEIRLKVEESRSGGVGETLWPGTQAPSPANAGSSGVATAIILDWRKIAGHENDSTISNVTVNGKAAVLSAGVENHPVGETPTPLLRKEGSFAYEESNEHLIFRDGVVPGENVIKLDFTSPILTSGSAITRYVDKEDGAEYIYSLFVPSDASTAFPVFDQPDLKARFTVSALVSGGWTFITNSSAKDDPSFDPIKVYPNQAVRKLDAPETKPISTYVFAFAAGPWKDMSTRIGNEDVTHWNDPDFTLDVYVRASQAKKYEAHRSAVANLTRNGIKYLESYFDYKFPFPKYDLVLIPEFPFGGMEHAGATFLRESSVIFPTEPTKGDYISRANLIFHETAHQWFGDTVTMKWFDDLWLKEGFAEFMAYKTLEHVMPDANAWKVFYERNKQAAYATDSTKGTTPIYQPIDNLSSAKSAYGNIVYRKAPSFLRQAEFYLGEDKFQTAVRAFLKKHEFANAGWEDLVGEFERASGKDLKEWAGQWVKQRGAPITRIKGCDHGPDGSFSCDALDGYAIQYYLTQKPIVDASGSWPTALSVLIDDSTGERSVERVNTGSKTDLDPKSRTSLTVSMNSNPPLLVFPNYGDYGYGIFLLDPKSREYVLKHIGEETDPFLRSMMWGSLWDSVREGELDPREFVELAVRQLNSPPCLGGVPGLPGRGGSSAKGSSASPCSENRGSEQRTTTPSAEAAATPPKHGGEQDETIVASLLGRVSTALNYYIPNAAERVSSPSVSAGARGAPRAPSLTARAPGGDAPAGAPAVGLRTRLEDVILDRMQHAETAGQRITFYRAYLNIASTEKARGVLKAMLRQVSEPPAVAGGLTRLSTGSGEASNVGASGVRAGASPPSGLQVSGLNTSAHGPSATQASPSEPTTDSQEGRLAPALLDGGSTSTDTPATVPLRTKDRFDIVTRLIILGDPEAPKLLADLEKTETSDDAKRYAYAAHAAFATKENREKFWNDFVSNKDISESWIEAAIGPFNSIRHDDLSLPYLQKALALLPTLKRDRKIFFVNGWLAAFIGGQRSQAALDIVNKFLADNPGLDKDLRLKILENVDVVERAVRIRGRWSGGAASPRS